jgi:peptide/nickel transport system substrate-binding protein
MARRNAAIVLIPLLVVVLLATPAAFAQAPDGQVTIAFDTTIAPTFLDPAETPGIGTPFVFLYAMHDALIKPLPGNNMAPCLAESWKESADGLSYEFKLREGLKFHNGDPFTADDVKFSFHRYRGASAKLLHERVKSVDVLDRHRIRFVLGAPWPDFLVFYATPATGAAWVVPKKYIEKVGEEGFKRQPVGLGPYRFVSMSPGQEIVFEANEQYWRKKPTIKRVVIKGVPDRTTRLAMLKTGEADIGYLMVGVVGGISRAVEPEIAVGRSPRPPRRHHGDRQASHQRGGAARVLAADRIDHPERHGLRPEARSVSVRSVPRQAPAGRGGLPPRLRRG